MRRGRPRCRSVSALAGLLAAAAPLLQCEVLASGSGPLAAPAPCAREAGEPSPPASCCPQAGQGQARPPCCGGEAQPGATPMPESSRVGSPALVPLAAPAALPALRVGRSAPVLHPPSSLAGGLYLLHRSLLI